VPKAAAVEENTTNDAIDREIKKLRRRKKKYGFEALEESKGGHRVIICDEQIDICYTQAVSPSLLDDVKTSGSSCPVVFVVSELGSGIARGFMNLGRLFQGKYIPPERTDGLPPQPDKKVCIEDEATVEVIGENSCFQAKADIDLD